MEDSCGRPMFRGRMMGFIINMTISVSCKKFMEKDE
jgi:hypothetical protein